MLARNSRFAVLASAAWWARLDGILECPCDQRLIIPKRSVSEIL